jgi:hypothetical protein
MRTASEAVGTVAGWVVAPVFGALALVRRTRPVHPTGDLYEAHVERAPSAEPFGDLAERLRGPALVRFSRAFFRSRKPRPDLFGCAVRFLAETKPPTAEGDAAPGDQDLLFTTVRSVWTIPLATLATNHRDYLANDFYGVSPFEIDGQEVYLRLVPEPVLPRTWRPSGALRDGVDAETRLEEDVTHGRAALQLEISRAPRGPFRRIAVVRLTKPASLDGERVRFHPAFAGRGIRACGPMQRFRLASYSVAQRLRPRRNV